MTQKYVDSFGTRKTLTVGEQSYDIFRLDLLEKAGFKNVSRLPVSLKVLLENLLRQEDNHHVSRGDIEGLANWNPKAKQEKEIAFMPARVLTQDLRVVPPDTGICHQVNLEYLGQVTFRAKQNGATIAYPDTVVGMDSHTPMINGLGVVGWGVGGIEAEAALLGQPIIMLIPDVIGFKLHGRLRAGATSTDLVLTVTQMLRKKGVVEKFVEFYGSGLSSLSVADRATIGNMSPEYGATIGFFPVDNETLRYLQLTGRDPELIELVEAYTKEQGMFRTDASPDPVFTDALELDLDTVEPSLAGPKRPQDRVPLAKAKSAFQEALPSLMRSGAPDKTVSVQLNGDRTTLGHGTVVISAITSCTNTSNPSVLIGAGLLAKKAGEKG